MSSCWPDSAGTWDVLFWNVSSMKEPLAREPRWLPSGTLLHVGGFILSHLFSPRRFLIKSVPGVVFFFEMHFDSAEMRFLRGDIRCSPSKDTDWWLDFHESDNLKISASAYILISHGCWRGATQVNSACEPNIFTTSVLFYFFNSSIETQNDHFLQVSDIFISESMS